MECLPGVPHLTTIIWVGGTSALARTYVEELKETIGLSPKIPARFILAGVEEPTDDNHVHLDVTSESSVRSFFSRIPNIVNPSGTKETRILVLSIRQPLVVTSPRQKDLITHLDLLVRLAVAPTGKTKSGGISAGGGASAVVHVSSIAVVDHLRAQRLDDEDTPLPPIESYKGDYDVFKRRSEEIINDAAAAGHGGAWGCAVDFAHVDEGRRWRCESPAHAEAHGFLVLVPQGRGEVGEASAGPASPKRKPTWHI